jgi:N-sulfoglucosamine sulfohydrolase
MRYCTALLAVLACALAASAADAPRRNAVLLIADDLGLDLACYGNTKIKMPNIDGLASRGTRFSHAFAAVSSCSSSRAVMLTGMHTHTNGQVGLGHGDHNMRSFPHIQSLPRVLNAAGYRTGIVGKVHVEPKEVYPFSYVASDEATFGNRDVGVLAKQVSEFLAGTKEQPFFLVVGFGDPHRVMNKGFANDRSYPGIPETKYDPKDVIVPYHLPDQPEVRAELADFYQSASRMDHGVGLVLAELKKAGHADDTLLLFVSDNGIPFPGAKTTLYDSGLHLPLIIASPTQKRRGLTCTAMASFTDLAPTIYDWTSVKPPANVFGRSLLPVLEQENPKGWDIVYASHQMHEITMYYPMRMVRTRKHKYLLNLAHKLDYPTAADLYASPTWQGILKRGDKKLGERDLESFVHRPREELYDLEADPKELHNVASDPKYAEVLEELRGKMKEWQTQTKDRWLHKYKYE